MQLLESAMEGVRGYDASLRCPASFYVSNIFDFRQFLSKWLQNPLFQSVQLSLEHPSTETRFEEPYASEYEEQACRRASVYVI